MSVPGRRQIESDDIGNRDWRESLLQMPRERAAALALPPDRSDDVRRRSASKQPLRPPGADRISRASKAVDGDFAPELVDEVQHSGETRNTIAAPTHR
jgi:hypothetical protein